MMELLIQVKKVTGKMVVQATPSVNFEGMSEEDRMAETLVMEILREGIRRTVQSLSSEIDTIAYKGVSEEKVREVRDRLRKGN